MRNELKTIIHQIFDKKLIVTFGLAAALSGPVYAFKSGHGSVLSDAGAPLQIAIPLLELTAQEMDSLQVAIAEQSTWSKIGLTPPVSLDALKVNVVPGFTPGSRRLMISSAQPASRSPVDILLDITTSSGSLQIQSSYLVTLPADTSTSSASATSAGKSGGSATGSGQNLVKRGETLYSIAQRNAVSGVDMYQMLAALFEANPDAFISGNMNLLRTGATLTIPDAETIRAVDKARARKLYQAQVQTFNDMRRANLSARTAAASAQAQNQSGKGGSAKSDASSSAGTQATTSQSSDQVRLTSNSATDQKDDVRTAAKNEAEELNARIKTLQQNVDQLKDANTSTSGQSAANTSTNTTATPAASSEASTATTPPTGAAATPAVTEKPTESQSSGSGNAKSGSESAAATEKAATPASNSSAASTTTTKSDLFTKAGLASRWDAFTVFLAENIMYVLAAVLAFGALVIAWMMRRAGERHDDEPDDSFTAASANPGVQSAFGQKLSDIDLNLEPVDAVIKETASDKQAASVPPTLTKHL
jgi:pilus assembly protein FimV